MNITTFYNEANLDLAKELRGHCVSVCVRRLNHGRPDGVVFVDKNGGRLVIRCRPTQISAGFEIGILDFERRDGPLTGETDLDPPLRDLNIRRLYKARVPIDNALFDCGFVICEEDRLPTIVLAGEVLATLALHCPGSKHGDYYPEFSLSTYSLSPW